MQLLDDAKGIAARGQERLTRPLWIRHLVDAGQRFSGNNGNQYAAAITYFSFLALFPLILLVVSVVAFVLKGNPQMQSDLIDSIERNMPGSLGSTVKDSVNAAINARAGVGLIGLVGLLLTGLGWIGNLRTAVEGVWGQEPDQRGFLRLKAYNLVVLVVLGLAAIASLGVTAVGTSLTDQVLSALNLSDVTGMHYVVKILGIALPVAGDMIVFSWLLVRLPRTPVRGRVVVKGALLASVGFEILKVAGTYYIAHITSRPTVGIFGSVIGILVWINILARFLLFCTAWVASAPESVAVMAAMGRGVQQSLPAIEAVEREDEPEPEPDRVSPAGVAGSIFGAGVAVGGASVALLTARARRRPAT